ncbi:N-acetylmannosamine-6-phosphate 2-epimerase [soil metagenome]
MRGGELIAAGSLIVSCQADPGSPFATPEFIAAFAEAAVRGGALALRLEGVANIRTVRAQQNVPIIGLTKRRQGEFGDIYITPHFEDVEAVANAGADLIAFDATTRERPVTVAKLVEAVHTHSKLALADVSTVQEAVWALEAGADCVSTTLSGYTSYSPQQDGPDLKFISDLAALGIRPLAEGRIRNPEEAREALDRGAYAVVVGSAITRPEVVTGWFRDALEPQATLG